ncbi:ABC transporter permease [Amycolatopsis cihanbeyliensis]|uniref:Transport permease protein n=1 Tax=Amycolatopsis cihanbeyliensis TaxID=1128664 RepID=A0A542DIH1_AMYCI|nr:ABC transporter permease [Amycolatopsis cihanbeyliensis]TQJ02860.1 ABC-2 type transport system permease protein [Amycolatopsis cihanbeyliensis]
MTTTMRANPGALRIGLARGGIELRQFFRQREHAVFTFSLPAFLMVLLGTIFDETFPSGVTASQVFAASIIGAGIISTSFVSMGIGVALDREDGTLKRLRGTPMPATAYFLGKVILVGASSLAQLVFMLAIAIPLFDLRLPDTAADWLTLGWLFVLGTISCGLLGVAASGMARSVSGASAGMQLVYVGLQFTSGVFVPIGALPSIMVSVSSLFPVKWICQGFRSVFLPEHMAVREVAGQWELGTTALILGAWCVAGLLLCRLTFRWTNRAE